MSLLSDFIKNANLNNPENIKLALSYLQQDIAALNQTGTGDVVGPASATNNNLAAFNGTTGKLVKDSGTALAALLLAANNLSDLVNAGTARTNLGLGGAALLAVGTTAGTVAAGDDSRITGAAQKTSNLSDLASVSTARTNLGLSTIATATAISKINAAYTPAVDGIVVAFTVTMPTGFGTLASNQVAVYSDGVNPAFPLRLNSDEYSILGDVITLNTAPVTSLIIDIFRF